MNPPNMYTIVPRPCPPSTETMPKKKKIIYIYIDAYIISKGGIERERERERERENFELTCPSRL